MKCSRVLTPDVIRGDAECIAGTRRSLEANNLHCRVTVTDCHRTHAYSSDESRLRGGFIPAEILVQNSTSDDNGTAGRTLKQQYYVFW